MNFELSALNLQDLELLLSKSNCSCHFINPNKTRIILWKEEKDGVVTYYLRIGIQKFISYPLTDKNGETYWRFKPWETKLTESQTKLSETPKEAEVKENPHPTPHSELDPITKFNQRQAQAINHGEPNNSVKPSVNSSAS